VLAPEHWRPVLDAIRGALLTPVGVRTLAPGHLDYRARYDGDLRARDAAYHQGTAWGWLLGPLVDAWRRAYDGDPDGFSWITEGIATHLSEACLGQASEIFDAEAPYTPRGCVAQAWSVAELIRCLVTITPS
jgi:glycogen debranching enzyme